MKEIYNWGHERRRTISGLWKMRQRLKFRRRNKKENKYKREREEKRKKSPPQSSYLGY